MTDSDKESAAAAGEPQAFDRLSNPKMNGSAKQVVRACLIGLLLALLLVGAVSGTLLRHVVQILPLVAALVVLQGRPTWGAYAAFPILVFWIFIVLLIWLFLFGLSRIANGHYTPIEIVSTILMAAFCVIGVTRTIPLGRDLSTLGRVGMFVVFAAMQFAARWVSFLKPIANR